MFFQHLCRNFKRPGTPHYIPQTMATFKPCHWSAFVKGSELDLVLVNIDDGFGMLQQADAQKVRDILFDHGEFDDARMGAKEAWGQS
jgi:hypothetical protein